jgi:hypothetical protein
MELRPDVHSEPTHIHVPRPSRAARQSPLPNEDSGVQLPLMSAYEFLSTPHRCKLSAEDDEAA